MVVFIKTLFRNLLNSRQHNIFLQKHVVVQNCATCYFVTIKKVHVFVGKMSLKRPPKNLCMA